MKRNLFIATVFALFYFGCSENIVNTEYPVEVQNKASFNWMKLPAPKASLSAETEFTTAEKIVGNFGGLLNLNGSYSSSENATITVTSSLQVPALAYTGAKIITQVTSASEAVSDFYPSMSFNVPLVLNIKYTGLDLNGVDPATVGFFYIAENGMLQIAENRGILVDPVTGTLEVIEAKIPHFSRYGFIKGPEENQ